VPAAARAQSVLSVRLIALCAPLGVLRLPSGTTISPTAGPSGIPRLTEDERAWLIRQLDTENFHDRLLSAYLADAIVAAMHDGTDTTEEVRDVCLEILNNDGQANGDRALAWAVLLRGCPHDPAVVAYVCQLLANDGDCVQFLGGDLRATAYADDSTVADAVEAALRTDPQWHMVTELHAMAVIDHGPVIRAELLKSLATSGT